ncbi:PhnD/SsuA/transferrin family substrate-binding protein [Vannielia litorea]|uniref:Phosphonate transport system substrate-binding protein n=1 Tax=Vannielia litorea TaxID=1217970 RepID=A0A1N6E0K4_9RHOB|nr:PhnD/SsuA/transferrin family substrate-binding protein [Vannielia litorea]SIN76568.1 phosphonate transport system substrate-binding protein [Vannielia litorea]
MDRRHFVAGVSSLAVLGAPVCLRAARSFRLGLTPVFLDNDAIVIDRIRTALSVAMGEPVELIQRRTYQEITATILDGSVDAAWICGYPFLQQRDTLSLLGVPVWRGRPLYQSYLIVGQNDPAEGLEDLHGHVHAFSDPDSNSGYLVTASDLARMGMTPERFFARSVFTYGHRNVVRAVADGLTRSGSVDGYVWEVLSSVEPALTERTRVITRSEWLGFPPLAARADRAEDSQVQRFGAALRGLGDTEAGRDALRLLFLDRIDAGSPALFDGIAARMADVPGR